MRVIDRRAAALAACALALTAGSVSASGADEVLRAWRSGFKELPGVAVRVHSFETTQEVYRAVTGADPSRWKGPRNSVEMVSWDDATGFCRRATALLRAAKLIADEQEVRLPTEAEWEAACRAGSATAYSFGEDPALLGEFAWFSGNAAGNDPPVGAKRPNAWGLYDLHGYVWEWCADDSGASRVVRGGAWTSSAGECRSDSRKVAERDVRRPDVGFRCVLASGRR